MVEYFKNSKEITMNSKLYRKSQQDKLTSPEDLNNYIKVTNPGVWIILSTIIAFLLGVCVWGFFGKLETKLSVACIATDRVTTCYVKESKIASVATKQKVYVDDKECQVTSISKEPIAVTEDFSDYALHVGELTEGEWVYEVIIDTTLDSGVYKAQIVVNSVNPFYFIFN